MLLTDTEALHFVTSFSSTRGSRRWWVEKLVEDEVLPFRLACIELLLDARVGAVSTIYGTSCPLQVEGDKGCHSGWINEGKPTPFGGTKRQKHIL